MNNTLLNKLSEINGDISVGLFSYSIILSFLLAYILSKFYIYFSKSLSNPYTLARILPLITIGTTLIISIIKSSLALSLGLVGALSIVRFRTPIKEPEELSFIFFSIGLGIACGANQYKAACLGLILIMICLYLLNRFNRKITDQNSIRISISYISPKDTMGVIGLITKYCKKVDFKNLSVSTMDSKKNTAIALSIIPKNKEFTNLDALVNDIYENYPSATLTIVDSNF